MGVEAEEEAGSGEEVAGSQGEVEAGSQQVGEVDSHQGEEVAGCHPRVEVGKEKPRLEEEQGCLQQQCSRLQTQGELLKGL